MGSNPTPPTSADHARGLLPGGLQLLQGCRRRCGLGGPGREGRAVPQCGRRIGRAIERQQGEPAFEVGGGEVGLGGERRVAVGQRAGQVIAAPRNHSVRRPRPGIGAYLPAGSVDSAATAKAMSHTPRRALVISTSMAWRHVAFGGMNSASLSDESLVPGTAGRRFTSSRR